MTTVDDSKKLFKALPLLEWLPDETLFSLISRIHHLSGHQNASLTSNCLFRNSRYSCHHDFPSGLSALENQTDHLIGAAHEIALNKTLLKYYRAFIPTKQSSSIAKTMCGSSVAHLKFQLGLITSRFRANHPLKACPECILSDREKYGWAYWHLEHQYPGVWWCSIHNQTLHESIIKSTGVNRFSWYLPNTKELRYWLSNDTHYPVKITTTIKSVAITASSIVNKGCITPWNTDDFWLIYRKELANRGWMIGERLRYSDMISNFLIYSSKLHILPEFSALPTTKQSAKAQLGRLFRQPRCGTHPLRHIILIDWLFGGIAGFIKAQNNSDKKLYLNLSNTYCKEATKDLQQKKVIALIREQNLSVSKAASQIGVDINIAMEWCTKANISINRRPKILKDGKRDELVESLRKGEDKTELASKFDITLSTINRLLRTISGLKTEWQTAQFNQARDKHRKTWRSLIKSYKHLGTKLLRSLEPAVYAWLYRNDREWLRNHSPHSVTKTHTINHSNMWDKRDIVLSTEVKRTALKITEIYPGKRIYLWQLYQQLPELKAKLEVLDKLPLTKTAIEQVLSYSKTKLNSNQYHF